MIVNILRYGNNGEGIAQKDGKIIFIDGALQSEIVDITITQENVSFCKAKINKVIMPSPNRVKPPCPYFGKCGGCQLQHINYLEQLRLKSIKIRGNLKKYANFDGDCEIKSSNFQYNYRNHMRFAVVDNKLCLHKNKSKECVIVNYCHIACDAINCCIEPINEFLSINKLEIDEVDIKSIKNQIIITFISKTDVKHIKISYLEDILSPFFTYGFYIFNKQTNQLNHLKGIKKIEYQDEITCFISPLSFLQVNNEVARMLYNDVRDIVQNEVVVDAFCGRGTLSCKLAKKAKKVYGIEIEKSSVSDAMDIQRINNIQNVQFILGDSGEVLSNLYEKFDCLVLDPPRGGVQRSVISNILNIKPKKIVYISCASNTLARDLKELLNIYTIKNIKAYDMFPQTDEVETVVIMEKIDEKNSK